MKEVEASSTLVSPADPESAAPRYPERMTKEKKLSPTESETRMTCSPAAQAM